MAQPIRDLPGEMPRPPVPTVSVVPPPGPVDASDPNYQAFVALQTGFVIAPLVAGLDKYFHLLTNWDRYLAPSIPRLLGLEPHAFMQGVGAIEIVAAIGVAVRPRLFGPVVGLWLLSIVANLLLLGDFYDVALRDFGLAIAAFALSRLAVRFEGRRPVVSS